MAASASNSCVHRTSWFRIRSHLSVFDQDGSPASSSVSTENPHYKALWKCRLCRRYRRARRDLHCWNSNNFHVTVNNPVRTKQKPLATGLEDVLFISCFALNILPDPFPFLLPPLCLLTLPSSHTQLQALLSIMHSYSVRSSPKPPDWLLTLAGAELNKRTFHPNLIHSSYQAVVLVDS